MIRSSGNKTELRIHLLGGFHISIGDEEISPERFRLRKARNLVKLLALATGGRLHREQLMEQLWPESDPESAANNLHQTLYAARRILAASGEPTGDFLIYEGESLSLAVGGTAWVDVRAFELAAGQARRNKDPKLYQKALELYTGDLLPEDPYEEWAISRRDALRQVYLSLLLELGKIYEARGDYMAGIEVFQKLTQAEPANEEAHVGLMRLFALNGQRQPALRQYQVLQETLQRELGIEPDIGSTQLYKDIQSGKFQPSGNGEISPKTASPRHNLPGQLSSFIGRETEIARVKDELGRARLITLTGSGGVGKTRLTLQVAEQVLETFPGGVWYIELAPVIDPDLVPQTVASELGLVEEPGRPLVDTLARYLSGREALLVLDNCEHLLEPCARLTEALLKKAPRLRIMISSREALGIAGESAIRVPSLAAPDPRHLPPLAEFAEFEAVRLFSERARTALPAFQIDDRNAPAIAQICQRLDGIPLALELAAARLNLLTTEQIAGRLDDAFRLLTGGSRTALPRHQTLRAAIDWSYRLLSEQEQTLLRRMTVFAGGAIMEAIEAICTGEGLMAGEILDALSGLAKKSMVSVERIQHAETRYRLLETVRQYAREKLNDSGESATFYDRSLGYYLELAETIEPQLRTSTALEGLELLNNEIANLRTSLSWAVDGRTVERIHDGVRLASLLLNLWVTQNYLVEGSSWLERGLSILPDDDPAFYGARARACFAAGWLLGPLNRLQARQRLTESLEYYRKLEDIPGQLIAQSTLGETLAWMGNYPSEAEELCKQSLATARTMDDPWLLAWVLRAYGVTARRRNNYSLARLLLEESLSIYEKLGDRMLIGDVFNLTGDVLTLQGDYPGALNYYNRALVEGQAKQSKNIIGQALGGFGSVACLQEEFGVMEANFRLALETFREAELSIPIVFSLRGVGIALKHLDQSHLAVDCYFESLSLAQEVNDPYGVYAAMAGIAGLAVAPSQSVHRVRILAAVERLILSFTKPLDSWDQREFDRDLAAAKAALSAEVFSQAWTEGYDLSLEAAIQETLALGAEIQSQNN